MTTRRYMYHTIAMATKLRSLQFSCVETPNVAHSLEYNVHIFHYIVIIKLIPGASHFLFLVIEYKYPNHRKVGVLE